MQAQTQGSRENFRGSGKIYVVTALIEYLTVLLEYIDFFGAEWGPGQNAPVANPPRRPCTNRQVDDASSRLQAVYGANTSKTPQGVPQVKLVPLTEQDDIEAYLVTFERIMQAYDISHEQWTYFIALSSPERLSKRSPLYPH